jgi:HK97 family phage portal protein
MDILGLTITRKRAPASLSRPDGQGGWWPLVRESFAGAWQRNVEVELANVLTYAAVFACITLIKTDVGKLRLKLVAQDANRIWTETESPAYSPVLRKPNRYQTRIQFLEQWVSSKLISGNTYVLKERDGRGVVSALYVLDPTRVQVLVAEDGSVFYELKRDTLNGLPQDRLAVPASEIIHDIYFAPYHPLVGVGPLTACGLAAIQGLRIQDDSALFFANGAQPGGILSAPGAITEATAKRLKDYWDTNFSGANKGKVAVAGDGLKYEALRQNAAESQLIEQLKWTAEDVCTAFRVPPHKIGIGPPPAQSNVEALDQQYYSQCLQILIESIELLLDEGLELAKPYGTELDVDSLLRMDTATRMKAAIDALHSGLSFDETRFRFHDAGPVPGGASPLSQQQYFSLEALAERDANKPFAKPEPSPPAPSAEPAETLNPQKELSFEGRKAMVRGFTARILERSLSRERTPA